MNDTAPPSQPVPETAAPIPPNDKVQIGPLDV
ncbi:hypothetical protein LMG1873_02885 [Achromobacter piechaudii]|uniref:Uncharacterized protein n=1 Tax=Achromobacter piechaudii TaxID=72556 RepID=A0ABM8KY36_9BURK|nr:hypothetical protein LMG1873_02885 [Achromobacter piechaudii]CAB3959685.1 hypothetical protein LMG6103_05884 [Achromobacter piechaudii]